MKKEITTKMSKLPKGKVLAVVISIVLLLGVCLVYAGVQMAKSDDLIVQGSLKMSESTLNSKLPGTIDEVLVEEGQEVKKGDPLIKLTSETVEAKLQQAEGAEAAAQAQASKADAGARNQEVAQAKAAFDYAQKTYDRMLKLLEQEAISQATFDQVQAQYVAAKEVYNMAVEGARSEDKAAADALVTQASGAVAEVNSYLEDSIIKAPLDGIVSAINVNEGELISTGMPLASVTSKKDPWVVVNVKEIDLAKVKLGQMVTVTIPAYKDIQFEGKVTNVSQKPDFATKRATNDNGDFDILSYGVKVEILDVKEELYQGMTVFVDFENAPKKGAGNSKASTADEADK